MAQYGVITEQGDLGLGFDQLNQKDNKVVNEAFGTTDKQDDGSKVINEDSKNK